ncbi:MAG: ATP-binding cassette domain-containing protein, partial [Solirubrobacteraceae bacterium]
MAPLLELDKVSLAFGGLRALHELDIHVDEHEIVSVIGPNGAGKTTLFNVITGDIRFDGKSIVGRAPNRITQLGIARTFQSLRLFLNMTVKENVKAATYGSTHATPIESILRLPRARREEREVNARAEDVLGFFGQRLQGYRFDQPAYVLSYANRRRLEIARAMATGARMLLLDEPAAGMNPNETHEIVSVIGPNGAGKTTLFNVITGIYHPGGDIRFDGKSIVGRAPNRITQLGIARTFQSLRLFLNMTVKE